MFKIISLIMIVFKGKHDVLDMSMLLELVMLIIAKLAIASIMVNVPSNFYSNTCMIFTNSI